MMETTISNKEAYLTLFKLLSLEEQRQVHELISELLEDIEDAIIVRERKDEEGTLFREFVKNGFE